VEIQLTDKERLFLANQHEILSFLDKDNSEYHSKLAEQLKRGHKWLYEQSFDYFSENLSEENAQLVLDILQIYEMLQDAYDSVVDKTKVSADEIKFPGFDGNNEPEFMGFVDALKKDDRYVDVIENGYRNSHSQKIHRYSIMITKWEEFGKPYSLTNDQVLEILGK